MTVLVPQSNNIMQQLNSILFIAMLVSKKYLTSVTSRYGITEFNKYY